MATRHDTAPLPPIASLHMRGIVKRFPGVLAVDGVDFEVRAGEVHALLGENGAGKSTLMKILYGLHQPDAGTIALDGEPIRLRTPHEAIGRGIGMVHQHFMLVPSLTVAENVALGLRSSRGWLLDTDVIARRLRALSERYHLKVDPHAVAGTLAVGEQQRVELLRALYKGAALLILDEPTAVLTPGEADDLFVVLRQMTSDGIGIVFISHKLGEVLAITDRITVLRDGRRIDTVPTRGATRAGLAQMMVGRPILFDYVRQPGTAGERRLMVTDLHALNERGEPGLRGVALDVCAGEIVGVAGVSGNGQRELAEAIVGLRSTQRGTVAIGGVNVTGRSPAHIKALGAAYIPEERMIDGAIAQMTCAENYILQNHDRQPLARGRLLLNFTAIRAACADAIRIYAIKTPGTDTPIKALSGGNIQKLILARELARSPRLLVAAQPTRGVDIGATEAIHRRLLEERARGTAILLISEDLDEIMALSDRIAVMYEGQIVGMVDRADATVGQIGALMAGTTLTAHILENTAENTESIR
ncbi:MAG: ABC transporter ATP-binding protein [Chloroflexota bacterium]|nr:ABC transporter ATP-binding protein [Chloroflexota bacterium]